MPVHFYQPFGEPVHTAELQNIEPKTVLASVMQTVKKQTVDQR